MHAVVENGGYTILSIVSGQAVWLDNFGLSSCFFFVVTWLSIEWMGPLIIPSLVDVWTLSTSPPNYRRKMGDVYPARHFLLNL